MKTETSILVEGFEEIENHQVKILLSGLKFTVVHFTDLSSFDENAYRYFNDKNYYHGEINEMLQYFVDEQEDLLIQNED